MKKNKLTSMILILICVFALFSSAYAQQEAETVVKFDDTTKPGEVEISWRNGDIEVRGYDGDEVKIIPDRRGRREYSGQRTRGLRRVYDADAIDVEKRGNVITITCSSTIKTVNAEILVPKNASVNIHNSLNGDVNVENISGMLEVKTLNGYIDVERITGPVDLYSTNGDIIAEFDKVSEEDDNVFGTVNSAIDISVPADTKATFYIKTHNEIWSDFDFGTSKRSSRSSRSRKEYDINGGGIYFSMSSVNGSMFVRKSK